MSAQSSQIGDSIYSRAETAHRAPQLLAAAPYDRLGLPCARVHVEDASARYPSSSSISIPCPTPLPYLQSIRSMKNNEVNALGQRIRSGREELRVQKQLELDRMLRVPPFPVLYSNDPCRSSAEWLGPANAKVR